MTMTTDALTILRRLQTARYAMVAGNDDNELVPPESIDGWLDYIADGVRPPSPSADAVHTLALARAEVLMDAEPGSDAERELELVVDLIEWYERGEME